MEFTQLTSDIRTILQHAPGHISLCLTTDEGEMRAFADTKKSAASIIKVPIAMACLRQVEKGKIDLDEMIPITKPVAGTGVLNYMYHAQEISLKDAITLSIIVSDNIAANMVIDAVGMDAINAFFKDVGARNTFVRRFFMDHASLEKGIDNETTAADMNLFLNVLDAKSDVLGTESKQLLREIMANQQFKDKLPSYQNMFAEAVKIGNKTGTLNQVEHDIAYFENEQRSAYITVMATDLTHNHDGQQTIAQIGQKVLEYMS
ncbi:MAG TPA: serine hydrolase [Bacillota bacterium]|nr:serine hydrolase [Bacillota bacterium]